MVLRLRFDDFSRATPLAHAGSGRPPTREPILATVRGLLVTAAPLIQHQGLTLVGVAVANLDDDDAIQLRCRSTVTGGWRSTLALDGVRERFGSAAVTRAVLLGRDEGMSVPLLPD